MLRNGNNETHCFITAGNLSYCNNTLVCHFLRIFHLATIRLHKSVNRSHLEQVTKRSKVDWLNGVGSIHVVQALLYGVGDGLLKKLQAIQNAAARVVTGAKSSTTSRRCFVIFTGFQCARESSTNWLRQFISACAD